MTPDRSEGATGRDFDEQRRDWEFEKLAEEHKTCCAGALLHEGRWVNVICPVDSSAYRDFENAEWFGRARA